MMKRNTILLNLLLVLVLVISGCSGGKSTKSAPSGSVNAKFPVNETFAAGLTAAGIPSDLARFLAAAKMESTNPTPNTFVYHLYYPNGATREITMKFTPNQSHKLTTEEIAKNSGGRTPVYAFKYNNTLGPDWKGRLDMEYFVPRDGVPAELLASLEKTASLDFPENLFARLRAALGLRSVEAASGDSVSGVNVAWRESATAGVDWAIGSTIEAARDRGVSGAGKIAGIYALASAASAAAGAMDLRKQNSNWLSELDALEKCASNPTNQVAKSDPNYSKNAVDKVQSARSELKEVNAVRFLNQATETSAGLHPASAVGAVALKQGFVWSETTLGDYSENTIMREVRLAVVNCGDPIPQDKPGEGNVKVEQEWTITGPTGVTEHGITLIVSKVGLVWNPAVHIYDAICTFTYDQTVTRVGQTTKKSATGSGSGGVNVIDDPMMRRALGYGYTAGGTSQAMTTEIFTSVDMGGKRSTSTHKYSLAIDWLPDVRGFLGTGGSIEGVRTRPIGSDGGEPIGPNSIGLSSTGLETITYQFSVPPKGK
jgi:hypothetical protein